MQQRQGPGPGKPQHQNKKRKKFGGNRQGNGPNSHSRPNNRDQQGRGRGDHPQQQGRNRRDQHGRPRTDQDQNRKNSPTAKQPEPPRNYGRAIESHIPKRYGIVFYDTFQQARTDAATIAEKAKEFDQLNIVIKAEGDMNDPELKQYGMVYAGTAWHLIHTRRVEDGWYNEPR